MIGDLFVALFNEQLADISFTGGMAQYMCVDEGGLDKFNKDIIPLARPILEPFLDIREARFIPALSSFTKRS